MVRRSAAVVEVYGPRVHKICFWEDDGKALPEGESTRSWALMSEIRDKHSRTYFTQNTTSIPQYSQKAHDQRTPNPHPGPINLTPNTLLNLHPLLPLHLLRHYHTQNPMLQARFYTIHIYLRRKPKHSPKSPRAAFANPDFRFIVVAGDRPLDPSRDYNHLPVRELDVECLLVRKPW